MLDELSVLLAAARPVWAGLSERLLAWFASDYGFVGLLDNEGALACHSSLRSTNREQPLVSHCERFPPPLWSGCWGEVLQRRKPVLDNAAGAEGMPCLGVPLLHGSELLGSLYVSGREGGYAAEQLQRLTRLARAVASIVAARRETELQRRRATAAEEDLEQRNEEIKAVNETLRAELALRRQIEKQLSRALRNAQLRQQRLRDLAEAAMGFKAVASLRDLMAAALDQIRALLHSQQAALSVQLPDGETVHEVSVSEEHPRGNGEEEALAEALRTYSDVQRSRISIRESGTLREASDGSGPCLVVPMVRVGGERFGLVQVWDPGESRFDAPDRSSLLQITQIMSAELQLRFARQQISAVHDALHKAKETLAGFRGDASEVPKDSLAAAARDELEQTLLLLAEMEKRCCD